LNRTEAPGKTWWQVAVCALWMMLAGNPPALAHATQENAAQPERPRIGLALGGGGARGGAHIGVLKVLEELRVPVDCIAGTSMGALVGATFAAGALPERIEHEFRAINWAATLGAEGQRRMIPIQRKLAGTTYSNTIEFGIRNWRLQGDGGFLSTQNVEELLRLLIGGARDITDFDALPVPFRAVATDLAAGEMVVLGEGDLTRAMRASMAVPGLFAPVIEDQQVLADGGLLRNLPVDVARELCADVVIAVVLQAPPPQLEELQSLFILAGRSIDAMITANERFQLATLEPKDVAIVVPVADIRAGDFHRVRETIPLGENAARQAAGALQRYALPEEEYRRWREHVRQPEGPPVLVEEIRFRPLTHASPEYLASRLTIQPGEEVTLAMLESDMNRVFASGDFARVDYRFLPGDGKGQIVEIDAVERPDPDFLRFDLGLAGSAGGGMLFALRADHRREWVNEFGGQWRNALQLGQLSEIETAFYQPLDVDQRFYLEPGLSFTRSLEDIYDDGNRIERYDLFEGQARFDVGMNLGNTARVHTGLRWGIAKFNVDIGTASLIDRERARDASVVIGALYDSRDADALPTRGSFAQLELISSGKILGGEQSYEMFEGVIGHSARWGPSVLQLAVGGGRRLSGELPRYRDFSIGGVRSFPAFERGQLRGEGYWSGSASWLLRLGDIQPQLGQAVYGGFGLQAARVSDRLDGINEGTILGASFTLSARTPVGPLLLSLGAADNGSVQLHLALGRPISEGSMLDRLH
jgi:NTE family protein